MSVTGRLQNLRLVDPVLTKLARGYSNAQLIGDVLFPVVQVDKEGGYIPQFGKEAFKIYDSKRALNGKPNRILPEDRSTIPYTLEEYVLEYPMDHREKEEDMFDLEQIATNIVMEGIKLKLEKQIADLVQDADNFDSGNKTALTSHDKWSDHTGSSTADPVDDIEVGKEVIRAKTGKRPNVMVLGATAYIALKECPPLIEKIKYSMKGVLTVELLQEIFGIPKIVIGEAIYSSDAGVFADLWKDNAILAYVPEKASTYYQPSFGYTLRKKNNPLIYSYLEPNGLIEVVQARDLFVPKIVGAEAAYFIEDVV